ncbi:retrovirus-related Pol polyprotein from transposon 17.6 [Trichonephila clavipes]|nr:retrovirus-related Pol polyprotein from transposon 17.6 [Trichonephila clavipes]
MFDNLFLTPISQYFKISNKLVSNYLVTEFLDGILIHRRCLMSRPQGRPSLATHYKKRRLDRLLLRLDLKTFSSPRPRGVTYTHVTLPLRGIGQDSRGPKASDAKLNEYVTVVSCPPGPNTRAGSCYHVTRIAPRVLISLTPQLHYKGVNTVKDRSCRSRIGTRARWKSIFPVDEFQALDVTITQSVPSGGYEEEFVKNLYETIIANGKRLEELERAEKMRLEELERAEKMRLEELVKEQALKEKELQLKFDLERFKIESGFRIQVKSGGLSAKICPTPEKSDSTWKDFTFEITNFLDEWLIGLEINTFQDLKDLMVVDQLKKRANASMKDHFLDNWANLKSATQIAELFDNYEDVRKLIKGNLGYNFLPVEILNAVQTRSQVKAAREERGIDSGDAKKGEDEVIIVSSDAEDEILIPALQEYVPELALLRVTRENLINAQKNSEEIKPLYEQAASQVQVTNQVYSLEKELLVKNREDKLGNVVKLIVVPEGLRDPIKSLCHEGTSAHLGITKSKDKLNRYFYWPNCYRDMEQFVKNLRSVSEGWEAQ